ncbi:UPF0575 protein C19orf67 homolog [Festucalex cinctus]
MSKNITDVKDEPRPGMSGQVAEGICEIVAPSSGHLSSSSSVPVRKLNWNLRSMKKKVQYTFSEAMEIHSVKRKTKKEKELSVVILRSFIHICQPYFSFLESTARTKMLSTDIRRVQLLEFSQQMCDTLERMALSYAGRKLLTLDETDPDNMSHFCIGHVELEQLRLKVTAFRYCKPTTYLARVDTGVFKRMRWNVERLDGANDGVNKPEPTYYYLCCEDIPNTQADGDETDSTVMQMWSIGKWVQVKPDLNTDDILDWVLCDIPEGVFEKLLFLGKQEPTSCSATGHLLELLTSQEDCSSPSFY